MRIGIAGYGNTGSATAARLAESGTDILAWSPRPISGERAVVRVAFSARELAERSDVIISSLFDGAVLADAYIGASGLFAGGSGKPFIEMSTVAPETQCGLTSEAPKAKAAFIECAVSASTGPARQGQLLGLVGGSVEDFQRARPVLEQLCTHPIRSDLCLSFIFRRRRVRSRAVPVTRWPKS